MTRLQLAPQPSMTDVEKASPMKDQPKPRTSSELLAQATSDLLHSVTHHPLANANTPSNRMVALMTPAAP